MELSAEFARFRGGFGQQGLSARRIAGLLEVPGCARREVLDAAELPLDTVAELLGCPPGRQSPFAHARARQFEKLCTTGDMGPLLALVRDELGVPVREARERDLSAPQVKSQHPRGDLGYRARLTRQELAAMLAGDEAAVNLLRAPVLALRLGEQLVHLELDAVAYTTSGPLHPVGLHTFPCVDGVADPAQVAAAARQMAVHVLASRQLAVELGHPADRVATRGLLVIPRNFGLHPTGAVVDLAPQVRRLERILATFPDPERILPDLAGAPALPAPPAGDDPDARQAAAAQVADAVGALRHRFGDGCLNCPLFAFCRRENDAGDAVSRVGTAAANMCGGVTRVGDALELAAGLRAPDGAAEQALATGLGRAERALELVR